MAYLGEEKNEYKKVFQDDESVVHCGGLSFAYADIHLANYTHAMPLS